MRRAEPLPEALHLDEAAAPSVEVLVDRLLDALAAKDRKALEALRVTEKEYVEIIIPGNVDPGQPPQRLRAADAEFYWGQLNTKSIYSGASLLGAFGGQKLKRKGIAFDKGDKRFAWFTAYRQLRITAEDGQGHETLISTGSVAEVRGRFKFVSFVRD